MLYDMICIPRGNTLHGLSTGVAYDHAPCASHSMLTIAPPHPMQMVSLQVVEVLLRAQQEEACKFSSGHRWDSVWSME